MPVASHDPLTLSKPSDPIAVEEKNYKAFRRTFLTHRPGSLTTQGTLQIKTRLAQQHFLSLLTFAKRVKRICLAAQQDDPYADAYLLNIEQALEKAQAFLQKKSVFYQQQVPLPSGLLIPMMDTEAPLCLPVRFGIPYTHIAARVLADFDTLFRCVISLYQWGLLSGKPLTDLLRELSQPLRDVWKSAKTWQPTGLTRRQLIDAPHLANEISPSMGKLDPRVLNKQCRARYAPPIVIAKSQKNKLETTT